VHLCSRACLRVPTGNAEDGSAVVVFHGPNHKPNEFAKEDTVRAVVFVAATIFERRPLDQRWTFIIYAPGVRVRTRAWRLCLAHAKAAFEQ
jgi:hypothetical protein